MGVEVESVDDNGRELHCTRNEKSHANQDASI
jgi:hypothetical protein